MNSKLLEEQQVLEMDEFPVSGDAEKLKVLFKGMRFFLGRGVPRESLRFAIRDVGGEVSWDQKMFPGATFDESDESITHQVVNRDMDEKQYLSRYYIQPQWVFDCVNARAVLPVEKYFPSAILPPMSLFLAEIEGDHVPSETTKSVDLEEGLIAPSEEFVEPVEHKSTPKEGEMKKSKYLTEDNKKPQAMKKNIKVPKTGIKEEFKKRDDGRKNKPKDDPNPKHTIIKHYQEEITRLKKLLEEKKARGDDIPQDTKDSKGMMSVAKLQRLTELLEPYGITFEGDLSDIMVQLKNRKAALMKNNEVVKEEKEEILAKLQHATDEIRSAESEISDLVKRITRMESKMLYFYGEQDIKKRVAMRDKAIEDKKNELESQKMRQEELHKTLAEKQLTYEETCTALEHEVQEYNTKVDQYDKVEGKIVMLLQRESRLKDKHNDDISQLEVCISEMTKEVKLKKMLVDNFIPRKVIKDIDNRLRYDESSEKYFVQPLTPTPVELLPVTRMLLFPIFNKTRFLKLSPKNQTFFSNENLLLLEPEMPKWKAKPYVPDKINPKIESLIREAVKDLQKTLVINCDLRQKKSSSVKIFTHPAEYMAVGPTILMRKIPSEKYTDFSCVPSDITLPNGSNISTIRIPPKAAHERKFTHEELLALPFISLSVGLNLAQADKVGSLKNNS